MNPFHRHDMAMCGFLVFGIGVTAGMYGLADIGNSLVRVMYMRALNGAKALTAGYCNPADGAKTIGDTMNAASTIIGTVTGMTIVKASGMTMEDTKIVDSLHSCMTGQLQLNDAPCSVSYPTRRFAPRHCAAALTTRSR